MQFSKIKLQMVQEHNFNYNSRTITSAKDIVKFINDYEELEKATEEHIILICLDSKNKIVAYSEIAKGGINYCNIDIKTIFKTILLSNSSKFILAHNHPSGVAEVSTSDIKITEKLKQASNIMNIEFIDHLIIAGNDYISCMNN